MKPKTIAALLPLMALATQGQSAPTPDQLIESTLVSRIEREGGDAEQLWSRKWRIVILFNSSNAANNSAYTDLALTSVDAFLKRRTSDPAVHEVSFFPYQLDIYAREHESVQRQPLTLETVTRIKSVWPRIPFKLQSDGVTPYPPRGGHDNFKARKSAAELLKTSELPTLLIQISDLAISEAPGSPTDGLVRSEDRPTRGVEAIGIVPYETPFGPIATASPRQKLNLWIYGPAKIAPASTSVAQAEPSSNPVSPLVWIIPLAVLLLGGGGYLLYKTFGSGIGKAVKWSVKLPNSGGATIAKGETYKVVGAGSENATDPNTIVYRDVDMAATLFALEWTPAGLRVVDHVWHVETSMSGGVEPISKAGRLVCQDKTTGTKRILEIEVSKIDG